MPERPKNGGSGGGVTVLLSEVKRIEDSSVSELWSYMTISALLQSARKKRSMGSFFFYVKRPI